MYAIASLTLQTRNKQNNGGLFSENKFIQNVSVLACGSLIEGVNNHNRGSLINSLFKEVKPAIIKKNMLTS